MIYSGVYHSKAEAEKAKASLKKSFPAATVIDVSSAGSGSKSSTSSSTSESKGSSEGLAKPAPSSTLKSLSGVKGKSYEEKSKNLPEVVEQADGDGHPGRRTPQQDSAGPAARPGAAATARGDPARRRA